MKKRIFLLLSLFLLFPKIALAHSGFDLATDSTVIHVQQNPISPLIGEKVKLVFTVKQDKSIISNFPFVLTLIDTRFNDPKNDKVVLKKDLKTDVNGNASFEYTFNKANYFDVDLDFKDLAGEKQELGFLIQTREKALEMKPASKISLANIGFFILGFGSAVFAIDIRKNRKTKSKKT